MCRVATEELEGSEPILASWSRHWLNRLLGLWEMEGPAPTAELLFSELVTNAIRHGGGSPVITVSVRAFSLEVGVTDNDVSHLPNPLDHQHAGAPPLNPTSEGGRGLLIVDALASQWGTTLTDQGKHVWFRLDARDWPYASNCDCDGGVGMALPSGRIVHGMSGPWDH